MCTVTGSATYCNAPVESRVRTASDAGGSSMRAVVAGAPEKPRTGGVTANPTDDPGTSHRYGVRVTVPILRPTRRSGPKEDWPAIALASDGTATTVVSELTIENRAGASLEPPPSEPMPNANCPRPTVVTAQATPSVWSVTLGAPPIVSGALRLTGAACTTMLSRPGASGVTSPLESTR